jgi:hypothetical protein
MQYPEFKVKSDKDFVGFASGKYNGILICALPEELRRIFRPGVYTVQRVSRLHADVIGVRIRPVRSADHFYPDIPALYTDSMGMLCKLLCKLIGYKAEKPETVYVKIQKINKEKV